MFANKTRNYLPYSFHVSKNVSANSYSENKLANFLATQEAGFLGYVISWKPAKTTKARIWKNKEVVRKTRSLLIVPVLLDPNDSFWQNEI